MHDVANEKLIAHKNHKWQEEVKNMNCLNCGAKVMLQSFQTSANCPYCSTSLIATKQDYDGLKPDAIIPFKFGKEKAIELFKHALKNKWLVPNKFKNAIVADDIQAYYFPAFIFDAECDTKYDGRLYKNEEIETSDGSSETQRKYFSINGQITTNHNGIEIEASTKLTQFELNSIKPYNLKEAKEYTNNFVYGFSLECYSNSLTETNKQAKTIIQQEIKNSILSKYNYSGVDYLNLQTKYNSEKYSYCVLPVYRFNYTHKNKKYSNIMNGQTGALGGDYPKSALKILMIVLMAILLFAVPIIAIIMAIV